jgi:hypothetical protein
MRSRFDGRIAQLVEQLTLNQRVHGSSPCAPTIEINKLRNKPLLSREAVGKKLGIKSGVLFFFRACGWRCHPASSSGSDTLNQGSTGRPNLSGR